MSEGSGERADAIPEAPERIWTNAHAGSILTGSVRLAAEMRALGDTLVEYVRADLAAAAPLLPGGGEAEVQRERAERVEGGLQCAGCGAVSSHFEYIRRSSVNRPEQPSPDSLGGRPPTEPENGEER